MLFNSLSMARRTSSALTQRPTCRVEGRSDQGFFGGCCLGTSSISAFQLSSSGSIVVSHIQLHYIDMICSFTNLKCWYFPPKLKLSCIDLMSKLRWRCNSTEFVQPHIVWPNREPTKTPLAQGPLSLIKRHKYDPAGRAPNHCINHSTYTDCLSVHLSIHPSIYMYLSTYLPIYLSVYLFIYLFMLYLPTKYGPCVGGGGE